jgi:hypothetical protein
MSTVASPYGLKPVNLIGGQSFNGGVIREYAVTTNNTAPIFFGDMVKLTAGVPSVVAATPTAGTLLVSSVFALVFVINWLVSNLAILYMLSIYQLTL